MRSIDVSASAPSGPLPCYTEKPPTNGSQDSRHRLHNSPCRSSRSGDKPGLEHELLLHGIGSAERMVPKRDDMPRVGVVVAVFLLDLCLSLDVSRVGPHQAASRSIVLAVWRPTRFCNWMAETRRSVRRLSRFLARVLRSSCRGLDVQSCHDLGFLFRRILFGCRITFLPPLQFIGYPI